MIYDTTEPQIFNLLQIESVTVSHQWLCFTVEEKSSDLNLIFIIMSQHVTR